MPCAGCSQYSWYGGYGAALPDIDDVLKQPLPDPGTGVAQGIKDLPTDTVPAITIPGYQPAVTKGHGLLLLGALAVGAYFLFFKER